MFFLPVKDFAASLKSLDEFSTVQCIQTLQRFHDPCNSCVGRLTWARFSSRHWKSTAMVMLFACPVPPLCLVCLTSLNAQVTQKAHDALCGQLGTPTPTDVASHQRKKCPLGCHAETMHFKLIGWMYSLRRVCCLSTCPFFGILVWTFFGKPLRCVLFGGLSNSQVGAQQCVSHRGAELSTCGCELRVDTIHPGFF